MIRLIATDLDGTLLSSRSEIPDKNLRALKAAMASGVYVALATGRMPEATLPIFERIGANAPMVLFNGAMVYDAKEKRILYGKTIAQACALEILKAIEARKIYVQAFPGLGYYYEKRSAFTTYYEDKISVTGMETGMPLSKWLAGDVYKLLCLDESPRLDALAKELAPLFPEVSFIKSGARHLEIVAKGVNKAQGLSALLDILNITPEETLAFGDEENDLAMIEFAGTGYVMQNAPEHMRRAAGFIAPANTECGVARIIELYLSEKRMGGN